MLGTATIVGAVVLLATAGPSTPFPLAFFYTMLLGLGIGAATQVLIIAAQNAARVGELGVVTSTITLFRLLGGAFGTALFGAVLAGRLATGPTPLAQLTPTAILALPDAQREVVVAAFSDAMQIAYLLLIPVALAAVLVTSLIEERPLSELPRSAARAARAMARPDR